MVTTKKEFFDLKTSKVSGSPENPDTYKYLISESGVMARRVYIDTFKGGEDIDIMHITDTHLNHVNLKDFEEKNPVVLSTLEYRRGFRGYQTFENLERLMEYAPVFDKTIVTGDVMDYLTWGALEFVDKFIYSKRPDALLAVGGHDITRKMQGKVEDPTTIESRYDILRTTWRNDIHYHSEILDDRAMIVVLNNGEHRYHDYVTNKLRADLDKARQNNLAVVLFQHEQLCTRNPEEKYVDPVYVGDPNGSRNFCDDFLCNPSYDEESLRMYKLICENGDIIKGIFCGHRHNDYCTHIKANYTKDGVVYDTFIPQYVVCGTGYDMGHMMIVTIR